MAVKQYRLPRGHKEIMATIEQLKKLGIIRATHGPFHLPMWPVRKPDSTWRMMVDYQDLNKVICPFTCTGLLCDGFDGPVNQ